MRLFNLEIPQEWKRIDLNICSQSSGFEMGAIGHHPCGPAAWAAVLHLPASPPVDTSLRHHVHSSTDINTSPRPKLGASTNPLLCKRLHSAVLQSLWTHLLLLPGGSHWGLTEAKEKQNKTNKQKTQWLNGICICTNVRTCTCVNATPNGKLYLAVRKTVNTICHRWIQAR